MFAFFSIGLQEMVVLGIAGVVLLGALVAVIIVVKYGNKKSQDD